MRAIHHKKAKPDTEQFRGHLGQLCIEEYSSICSAPLVSDWQALDTTQLLGVVAQLVE